MNKMVIGLDVGATNVRSGVMFDINNDMIQYNKTEFKKGITAKEEIDLNICKVINQYKSEYPGKELIGIGISLAALVDGNTGIITTWPNHPLWNGFKINEYITSIYELPIYIEDDANSGALGEFFSRKRSDINNIVYISIGTGVGCGLIVNGSLFKGDNGHAGELGHVRLFHENTKCTCGNNGCIQSIIAGPAILKKYNTVSGNQISSLEKMVKLLETDAYAIACYKEVTLNVGMIIYNLNMLLDINFFVIGGGAADITKDFIYDIKENIKTLSENSNLNITIEKSMLQEFSGVYGAISLVIFTRDRSERYVSKPTSTYK